VSLEFDVLGHDLRRRYRWAVSHWPARRVQDRDTEIDGVEIGLGDMPAIVRVKFDFLTARLAYEAAPSLQSFLVQGPCGIVEKERVDIGRGRQFVCLSA